MAKARPRSVKKGSGKHNATSGYRAGKGRNGGGLPGQPSGRNKPQTRIGAKTSAANARVSARISSRNADGSRKKGLAGIPNKKKVAIAGAIVVGGVIASRGARAGIDARDRKNGYTIAYHNTSMSASRQIKKGGFKGNVPGATNAYTGGLGGDPDVFFTTHRRGGASKYFAPNSSQVTMRIKVKLPNGAAKLDDRVFQKDGKMVPGQRRYYRTKKNERFYKTNPANLKGAKITRSRVVYGNYAMSGVSKTLSTTGKLVVPRRYR